MTSPGTSTIQQPVDEIIHAQWIIPCASTTSDYLENHSLVMDKGYIKDILPTTLAKQRYTSKQIHTYNHHVLMPGFINAHTHVGMNYFRGLADDLALMDWLNNYIWAAEKKWLSSELVYDASLFAACEMIRSGTTCFNDMFYFLEATADAAITAGLRAHIGLHVIDFPTAWTKDTDESLEKGLAFYEKYHTHPLITPTMAPHAPYTVTDDSFLRVKEISERYQLKINLHLHETSDEIEQSLTTYKKRPIRRLHDLGFLSQDVIAIHMTQINEEDLDILKQTRPSIVHCPSSNMKLGSGICPVEKLRSQGLNVALGTDSAASNNNLNLFSEMQTATFLSKLSTYDPRSLHAYDTLRLATYNGAKALGQETLIGSLEIGKAADCIAITMDNIETLPLYHPASHLVYAADRQHVTDVWVNGKQLMKNRVLTSLDETEIKAKARLWGSKIRG